MAIEEKKIAERLQNCGRKIGLLEESRYLRAHSTLASSAAPHPVRLTDQGVGG